MNLKFLGNRQKSMGKAWRGLAALGLAMALAGCAGTRAFNEGNILLAEGKIEQGLTKLEEAVSLEPKNAEFRIALATRRASIVNRLLAVGESSRREGRITEAEKAYRQVQVLDAENAMARQGLEALVMERRHRLALAEAEALLKKGSAPDLADAVERVRTILAENPEQREALHLKARIDEARAKELRPEVKLAATFRKSITLSFRDAPLKSVLEVVAKVSGLNFYYDKDIRPDLKVTVFAKNTTIEDAMRLLLVTNQLEQKILNENSILIYPSTPQKLKDYQTLAVRSFYLANADVKAVSNSIKTIVKTKDLVIDERLGIIILRDTPEAIRMAERIVALHDLSDPEVMLEVEILEVKRSRLLELGIQWPSQLTLSPMQLGTTTTSSTGQAVTQAADLSLESLKGLSASRLKATLGNLTINARKEDQDADILANPRIRVRNREKAKVQIGDRVPVITTTSTSTGFVSESVNYVDVGLKLEVEPNIYLDREVAIKVNLEVSNLVREITSKSGTLSYQIGTRGANTVLRLKDGETQILAGLISDEDRSAANKVPGLGELPVAGRLFGSKKDETQRSEILLSITPHIVRSIQRPDMLAAEFESGTESAIGAQTLRLTTTDSPAVEAKDAPGAAGKPAAAGGAAAIQAPAEPAAPGTATLNWQAPAQVKVGEQFSAVLRVTSQAALRGMPVLLGFDPQVLQVVNVQEGNFFTQSSGQTNFSHRIDPAQGKVYVALVRQSPAGEDAAGINGSGGLVTVNFKSLKPGAAKIQVLSANAEPTLAVPITTPVEASVRVVQ